jgi:hypothetical protein
MNFPEIAESEVLSASLMSEAEMLEARLAVIRSPEIQNNLREVSALRERLKVLVAELAVLENGKMIPADRERPSVSSKLTSRETVPERKTRRARVTANQAYSLIVEALTVAPKGTMTRAELADKTGLTKPKIEEGIKSNSQKFEVTKGPFAVIKLRAGEA